MQTSGSKLTLWGERYLFSPSPFQKLLSYSLLPLTALYCAAVTLKRKRAEPEKFEVPIISVGNLTVGGSGKTPFCIALAKRYENSAVILRGYKRKSKGLIVVSEKGKILTDVKKSGDEAMLYAKSLKNASVIVSEDRKKAIRKALELKSEVIFLDDGFSKSNIEKFDILLEPFKEFENGFCLPSGPYREPKSFKKYANLVLKEKVDFQREVKIKNPTEDMILVTAISKPQRLDPFLPPLKAKIYFPDHYFFKKEELRKLIKDFKASSILTTQKDAVKMQGYGIELSVLELEMKIANRVLEKVDDFINNFGKIP